MPGLDKHVKILGAGPAGLTAALNLAAHGCDVTVYEHKKAPGARFHESWQIVENYSSKTDALLDLEVMGIPSRFYRVPSSSIVFLDSILQPFRLTGEKPFGYFVKRGTASDTLDSFLYKLAVDNGVTFKFNTRIDARDADIISGGSSHAMGIAKEIVFESDADDVLLTILDDYLTPRGFSYLFIIGGHGTIGTAVLGDFGRINAFSEAVVLRFQQYRRFVMKNPRESVSSVGFFLPKTARSGGKLYIGEAAGFQDYLFGLGIRRSIQSGYLAAKSIVEKSDYDELWRKTFGHQLLSGILNRFLSEQCGNIGYTYLLRFARHLDFQKTGYYLQNPSFFRVTAARILTLLWGNRGACKHDDRCAWCR